MNRCCISLYNAYGKTSPGEKFFTVFHSIANLFLWIMALSIDNVSLQNATAKFLPQIAISHPKCRSFPLGMFCLIWYMELLASGTSDNLLNNTTGNILTWRFWVLYRKRPMLPVWVMCIKLANHQIKPPPYKPCLQYILKKLTK